MLRDHPIRVRSRSRYGIVHHGAPFFFFFTVVLPPFSSRTAFFFLQRLTHVIIKYYNEEIIRACAYINICVAEPRARTVNTRTCAPLQQRFVIRRTIERALGKVKNYTIIENQCHSRTVQCAHREPVIFIMNSIIFITRTTAALPAIPIRFLCITNVYEIQKLRALAGRNRVVQLCGCVLSFINHTIFRLDFFTSRLRHVPIAYADRVLNVKRVNMLQTSLMYE